MYLLIRSYNIAGILAPQDISRLSEDSIDIIRKLIISGTLCLSERLAQQSKFDPVTSKGDEAAAAAAGSPLGSPKLTLREEGDGFAELTYEAFKRAQHLCAILQSRLEGLGKCFARRRRAVSTSLGGGVPSLHLLVCARLLPQCISTFVG